jgi:hypothetical protein
VSDTQVISFEHKLIIGIAKATAKPAAKKTAPKKKVAAKK